MHKWKLSPKVRKWIRISILVSGLLLFKVPSCVREILLENRKAEFGNQYSQHLERIHKELSTEIVTLSNDQSYAIFDISLESYTRLKGDEYLENLGIDMQKLYCELLSTSKYDLKIDYFHVNVRAATSDGAEMVFSRELLSKNCV